MRVVFELDDSIPDDALRYRIMKNAVETHEVLKQIFEVSAEIVSDKNKRGLSTEQYALEVVKVIEKLNI